MFKVTHTSNRMSCMLMRTSHGASRPYFKVKMHLCMWCMHRQVADLGLAYVAPSSTILSSGELDTCVPVRWTAPEVLLRGECSQVRKGMSSATDLHACQCTGLYLKLCRMGSSLRCVMSRVIDSSVSPLSLSLTSFTGKFVLG